MIVDYSKNLYRLAELCTQEAQKYKGQELNDNQVDQIESTIQTLFEQINTIKQNGSESKYAAYILCNRITSLQKSLNGNSAKVHALREKLEQTLHEIKESLPAEFLKRPPTSILLLEEISDEIKIFKFVDKFPPESKEKINEFIGCMKVMYQQANPELYNKMLGAWVDVHKIPLTKLPLTFEHLLEIVPHIRYLDLSNLCMMKFGFEEKECLEKYCTLIESCEEPTYLSCAGVLIAEKVHMVNPYGNEWDQPKYMPLDHMVFGKICEKKSLRSLDLTGCFLSTGKEIELLQEMPLLASLHVKDLGILNSPCQAITDKTLPFVTNLPNLQNLSIDLNKVTNNGLEKLARCNQLKVLDATFHEEVKVHNLDCFKELRNLTSLTIHCGYSFEDGDFLFLENLKQLTKLSLDGCYQVSNAIISKIKSQDLQVLSIRYASNFSCEFVKDNKALASKLQVLKIAQCSNINKESLKPLVGLPCLHTLILEDSQIWLNFTKFVGTATLDALLHLTGISTLRHLVLNKCSDLTEADIQTLREAMPHLETLTITQ